MSRETHALHYDLLEKSEIIIEGVWTQGVNLNELAAAVAKVLGLQPSKVLVIDVRDDKLAFDVLDPDVDPHVFVGKEGDLLDLLRTLPGVTVQEGAHVYSRGMLGWIAGGSGDAQETQESLDRAEESYQAIKDAIARRVIVFSSGIEVETGRIEDANTPMIAERLRAEGFDVTCGPTLKDDEVLFAGMLRRAVSEGYGVVITTGGVGAEDKDHSVESILRLDPDAATPNLMEVEKGVGRHLKGAIRIGVGRLGDTTLVALPGPNDEVAVALDPLVAGLVAGSSKEELAESIAEALRGRLREKAESWHGHGHQGANRV